MRTNLDHNYFLKEKWLDTKRTKNHPKNCQKAHSFCNFQYEWGDEQKGSKIIGTPVNYSIPNIKLPKNKQRAVTVYNQAITQQDLDDWIAQSLNRNLTSFLNPQKKFYIPTQLQDDLKQRYRNKSILLKGQQDTYFGSGLKASKRKYYAAKKNKQQISQLVFNYKNLQPKHTTGIPIKIRQNRHKKPIIKRRNAVYLDQDIHYGRFIKDLNKFKQKDVKKEIPTFFTQTQTMFYSYNFDSLNRKNCIQQTPCSITQSQFKRLKETPKDFLSKKNVSKAQIQRIHQKFRTNVMDTSKNAQKKIVESTQGQSYLDTKQIKPAKQMQSKPVTQVERNFKLRSIHRRNSNLTLKSIIDTKSIGKDKALEKKVLILLNDMQILSEQIDFEMSQLNIHVSQISLKTVDARPQTKWVIKAQQKLAQKQFQLSIDCYKQALIIQPQFFVPIFNIASLLQKQKMYVHALRWFEVCKQFLIDEQNVKFGLAIVYLKKMKFNECFNIIEELIRTYQQNKKQSKLVYYYIRSLCSKKLKRFEQAKSDYSHIIKTCKPSNYNFLSSFIFSMVFARSRRLSLKFDSLAYVNFRETIAEVYFQPESKIRQQNEPLKNLAKKLVNAAFFKRFSIILLQKLLEKCSYETIKSDSLIFIPQDQTAILLNGIVVVRNHLEQFDKPETICVLQQGGVIGGGKIDNFINQKSNNWFIARSDVQIIRIQRKSFNQFWKGQITFQVDFKYNFLKNVGLFKNLPDSTLFSICQKIQKMQFNYGTVLFNDCSYRNQVINKHGIGYGLSKPTSSTDPRFVNMKKGNPQRKKGKCRLAQLLKKHYFSLNQMKFKNMKYPGLFVVIKGKIQVQDDQGFRCSDLLSQRQYFGQNLLIDSDGFHNYGRMVVNSKTAELYHLPLDKLIWTFTSDDKKVMNQNTKVRQSIQTIGFLRSRFKQCQNTRINYKFLLNDN